MSVIEEIIAKRDQCIKWKEENGKGYDPAIDLYNRIIKELEDLRQERSIVDWLEKFHQVVVNGVNDFGYGDDGINLVERNSDGWFLDKELVEGNEQVTYDTLREVVIAGIEITNKD